MDTSSKLVTALLAVMAMLSALQGSPEGAPEPDAATTPIESGPVPGQPLPSEEPPAEPGLPAPPKGAPENSATSLVLNIAEGEAATPVERSVELSCDPPGGTHPTAAQACTTLTQVNGDFTQLEPDPETFCTANYDPVTATAEGTYNGKPVSYQETFGNSCAMASTLGATFDF